jgi:hypothetical protein
MRHFDIILRFYKGISFTKRFQKRLDISIDSDESYLHKPLSCVGFSNGEAPCLQWVHFSTCVDEHPLPVQAKIVFELLATAHVNLNCVDSL